MSRTAMNSSQNRGTALLTVLVLALVAASLASLVARTGPTDAAPSGGTLTYEWRRCWRTGRRQHPSWRRATAAASRDRAAPSFFPRDGARGHLHRRPRRPGQRLLRRLGVPHEGS